MTASNTGNPPLTAHPPVGSFVIERYVYTNRRGRDSGVQWLVQVVDKDGALGLVRVCKTRREAARFVEEQRG